MAAQKLKMSVLVLVALLFAAVSYAVPHPGAAQPLRSRAGAYELEVWVDGRPAQRFEHAGESYVLGEEGSRYVLRVHNRTGSRVEAVLSVDGLDVIDGKPADFAQKRGYLIPAHGYVDVDGWRLSEREAAAFRFAATDASYAAKVGRPRNIGVIGVALFPERAVRRAALPVAPRYPYGASRHRHRDAAPRSSSSDFEARAEASTPSRSERPRAPSSAARAGAAQSGPTQGAGALADSASLGPAQPGGPLAESAPAPEARRSGLGTEFGEALRSDIRHVEFVRQNLRVPSTLLGLRYNDRPGLYALGIDVDGFGTESELSLRRTARPFPLSGQSYARPPSDWRHD